MTRYRASNAFWLITSLAVSLLAPHFAEAQEPPGWIPRPPGWVDKPATRPTMAASVRSEVRDALATSLVDDRPRATFRAQPTPPPLQAPVYEQAPVYYQQPTYYYSQPSFSAACRGGR